MNIQSYIVILLAVFLSACHSPRRHGHRQLNGWGSVAVNNAPQWSNETIIVNGQPCRVGVIQGHKVVQVGGAIVLFEQLRVNQPVSGGFTPSGQSVTGYPLSNGMTSYGQTQYGPDRRFPGVDSGGVYHAQ